MFGVWTLALQMQDRGGALRSCRVARNTAEAPRDFLVSHRDARAHVQGACEVLENVRTPTGIGRWFGSWRGRQEPETWAACRPPAVVRF